MAKTFSRKISASPDFVVNKAKAALEPNGVVVSGNSKSGNFNGKISGSFTFTDNKINVTITKKPFIIPWALVESQINKFIDTINN